MKKQITIILTTVMVSLFLFSGLTFGEYNGYYGYDNYGYEDYEDFEFRFDNVSYHLDRYRGPIYYFHHPRADVYFVLVGNVSFVVPAYSFRPYLYRHNFVMVPRTRFISLSCCGLDYYDSHLRFNFYFDFFNRNKWSRRHYHKLRSDFRNYYHGRKHHKWYHENRRKFMHPGSSHSHKYEHRYREPQRQRVDRHKKYKSSSRNHYSSNKYSKSPKTRYYKVPGNSKKQIKKRNYKRSYSSSTQRNRTNRKNKKH